MKRGPRVVGELGGGGGGGCGWERQREITVHEINILVLKKSTRTVNLAQSKELRV
jgi:hypothetical protein